MTQGLYVAEVYGKIKPGITSNLKTRITSYTKGNNDAKMLAYYQAVDGYDEHIKNCENNLNHQLFPFLENPHKSHKASEYVDPKHTHIDTKYVTNLIEDRIKSHPLKIKRLKQTFLPITRYNVKSIMEGIKNFPDKYLEDI
jgi:hypothetical protein